MKVAGGWCSLRWSERDWQDKRVDSNCWSLANTNLIEVISANGHGSIAPHHYTLLICSHSYRRVDDEPMAPPRIVYLVAHPLLTPRGGKICPTILFIVRQITISFSHRIMSLFLDPYTSWLIRSVGFIWNADKEALQLAKESHCHWVRDDSAIPSA